MDNPIYSIHQALHHRSVFFIIHVESRVVECVSKDGMSIPGGDGIRRDVSGMGRHASAAGPNGGRPGQKKLARSGSQRLLSIGGLELHIPSSQGG
jgi:hypothetical protein